MTVTSKYMEETAYLKAKEELLTAVQGGCQQFFSDNGFILESAYYNLLHKNLDKAKALFKKLQDADIRAHWGYFLSALIDERIEGYPSYLELRNFYEVDLQLFFTYYLGQYIEKLCNYTDWLFSINPEIYKYTGRVFLKNNYPDLGIHFLKLAKENYFNDPELHYLLGEYNMNTGNYEEALADLDNCLGILPGYFPAERAREQIKTML